MNPLIIVLLVLLVVLFICPIYTYVIYPIILKLLPTKQYVKGWYEPFVSVVIVGSAEESGQNANIASKMANLKATNYPSEKFEILKACISGGTRASAINTAVAKAKGEIVIFTDIESEIEPSSLKLLLQNFVDSRVGVACGVLKKKAGGEYVYWKYENFIKKHESKIGRLSGANKALFAIRKEAVEELAEDCINTGFCLATAALQSGWDSILDDRAIAYEAGGDTDEKAFRRHVIEGAGYYQALRTFWRLLFPRKGSFTYVSHRVMKWLVPWNMIIVLVSSGALAFSSILFIVLFGFQVIGYLTIVTCNVMKKPGRSTGDFFKIMTYFVELNIAYLIGFFITITSYSR